MLCDFYGADPSITEALIGLAKETKARGWWQSYGEVVMPDWLVLYIGLEAAAARIRKYEPHLVPGLPQARAYMEAVIRVDAPHFTDSDVVYSDNLTGAIYLDKPEEIAAYEQVWNDLDRLALGVERSNAVISQVPRETNGI